jgi:hypothetical protein
LKPISAAHPGENCRTGRPDFSGTITSAGEERTKVVNVQANAELVVAVLAIAIAVVSNVASATPYVDPLAIKNAAGTNVEMVGAEDDAVGALGPDSSAARLLRPFRTPAVLPRG